MSLLMMGAFTSVETRVDAFNGFITGAGINGDGVFDSYTGPNNGNFGTDANWTRGAAPMGAPRANDIVIVNPAVAPNTVNVNVNAATNNLGGLLNNQILNIPANSQLFVGGFSGILNGGTINVMSNIGAGGLNTTKLDNTGTVTDNGSVIVNGPVNNSGTVNVNVGATLSAKGLRPVSAGFAPAFTNNAGALLQIGGRAMFTNGFVNSGILRGTPVVTGSPMLAMSNGDINNQQGGVINGNATFVLTGTSNYINQTTSSASPGFDTRGIGFTFNNATTLLEVASARPAAPVFGLADSFSIADLDLTSANVTLVDKYPNQPGGDDLFTGVFSIDDSSLFDIDGIDLWVAGNDLLSLESDIAAGLIIDSLLPSGSILNALYFPSLDATCVGTCAVPEPGSLALLTSSLIGVAVVWRRRRGALGLAAVKI